MLEEGDNAPVIQPSSDEPPAGQPVLRAVGRAAPDAAADEAMAAGQRASLLEQAESLASEQAQRSKHPVRGYFRWLRLSRLAVVAFVLLAIAFFAWTVPWVPSGLAVEDYTPRLAFTIYLVGGVAIAGILALILQELARRERERLLVWNAVYDESTGMRTRQYLIDRLTLECDRADRHSTVFSLLVLQLHARGGESRPAVTVSAAALQEIAQAINELTHRTDVVALLSGSELAVLALDAGRADRDKLLERIRSAVAVELPHFLREPGATSVKGGAATYGVDGTTSLELVHAARTGAMLAVPSRTQAT